MSGSALAVVIENERVYLKRLFDAETQIASILSRMIKSVNPFTFPIDFTHDTLSIISTDADQVGLSNPGYKKFVLISICTCITILSLKKVPSPILNNEVACSDIESS